MIWHLAEMNIVKWFGFVLLPKVIYMCDGVVVIAFLVNEPWILKLFWLVFCLFVDYSSREIGSCDGRRARTARAWKIGTSSQRASGGWWRAEIGTRSTRSVSSPTWSTKATCPFQTLLPLGWGSNSAWVSPTKNNQFLVINLSPVAYSKITEYSNSILNK